MRNTVVIYFNADLNDSVDIHTCSSISTFSAQQLFFLLFYSIFSFTYVLISLKNTGVSFTLPFFKILTIFGIIYSYIYLMDTLVLFLMPPEYFYSIKLAFVVQFEVAENEGKSFVDLKMACMCA